MITSEEYRYEVPASFETIVWLKDDGTGLIGKATVPLRASVYPTQDEIREKVKMVVDETGMRLCTSREFSENYLYETQVSVLSCLRLISGETRRIISKKVGGYQKCRVRREYP